MGRVLVVDDDRAIRELLVFVLQLDGHVVTAVENGQRALDVLLRAEQPWVVLMDVMMPGISGIEVCRRLLVAAQEGHELAERHVIALMTAGMLEEHDRPAPARLLIRKPFQLEHVARVINTFAAEIEAAAPELALAPDSTAEVSLAAG